MTNVNGNYDEDGPRLAGIRGAGETLKADELADQLVTIVDSLVVVRRDGSTAYKWAIEHEDGTIALHWAPGQGPPQQVVKWFRDNPGRPLYVYVKREGGERGYPRWTIEQRGRHGEFRMDADDAGLNPTAQATGTPHPDEIPF